MKTRNAKPLQQFGCGPLHLAGTDGLCQRHLFFDNVMARSAAGAQDRFEAFARPVRDILSQRCVATDRA